MKKSTYMVSANVSSNVYILVTTYLLTFLLYIKSISIAPYRVSVIRVNFQTPGDLENFCNLDNYKNTEDNGYTENSKDTGNSGDAKTPETPESPNYRKKPGFPELRGFGNIKYFSIISNFILEHTIEENMMHFRRIQVQAFFTFLIS